MSLPIKYYMMQAGTNITQRIETQYNDDIERAIQWYCNEMDALRNQASYVSAETLSRRVSILIKTYMDAIVNAQQVRRITLNLYEQPRRQQRLA
jgi:hypothetical protein